MSDRDDQQANQQAFQQTDNKQLTNEQQTTNKQLTTNKNDNNIRINYFINKYNKEPQNDFMSRMRFLHNIQDDEKYNDLTPEEETELRTYVLGRRY